MKTKYQTAVFWILPVLLWITLDEQMLLKILVEWIPEEYVVRSLKEFLYPRFDPFVFMLYEIPKLIPYLFLSLLTIFILKRFGTGIVLTVFSAGLSGIVVGWSSAFFVVADPWLTGPDLSSGILTDLKIIPVNMYLLLLVFFSITLIIFILIPRKNPSLLYRSADKCTKTSVKNIIILSLIIIVAVISWFNLIYPEYISGIAASVRTGSRKLERMLAVAEKNQNGKIIEILASNPQITPAALARIYDSIQLYGEENNDKNIRLLKSLAWNRSTPPDVLTGISKHKQNYIFYNNLSRNPGTPKEVLKIMAEKRRLFQEIKKQLAVNPNLPPESLGILAQDSDYLVRLKAAENPGIGDDILQRLGEDENPKVRQKADQLLLERHSKPK